MAQNNHVVKIKIDDQGTKKPFAKWCLVDPCNPQGSSTLCTKEFFGSGESSCVYEEKMSGNVTCPICIEYIKTYKKIKL